MAGLLDIFGTSGQDTMGLLGMSPEDITRSRDDAQAQALYALAGRLFQGGRGASSVLEGLQQGQQAYRTAMQGGMQQQLQNYQLQELLKKKQLEEQQRKDELMARQLFMRGYQPAVVGKESMPIEEDGRFIGDSQAIAARPARFDIGSIAPELMAIGPAGQAKLKTGLELQKSMAGDTFTLGEGQKQYQRNALTGEVTEVATGAPKREDIAGDLKEARQFLGITTPVNEMTVTERALVRAYIDRKDTNKAPKNVVDLRDPTAVAKAQLSTINQWQSTVKDTGDSVVAGRASAFYDAYGKAKAGNTSADGALIYNIAKVYDQTGAVQQGDVNTIIGNRSIPTNIQLYAQKFAKGGTFTPKEREDLKAIVDGIVTEREKALEPSLRVYRGLNQELGGKAESIINPYESVKKPRNLEDILGFGRPRGGQ
jgi:hypothetical protein